MRPLVHNLHASYIAYILQWSPRLQELFAAVLLNGSGGLAGALVSQVLRPRTSRTSKGISANQVDACQA